MLHYSQDIRLLKRECRKDTSQTQQLLPVVPCQLKRHEICSTQSCAGYDSKFNVNFVMHFGDGQNAAAWP